MTISRAPSESPCPGYIRAALHKFQHEWNRHHQDALHSWNQPFYGAKVQYANNPNESPLLVAKSVRLVQQVAGTFLYYAMAVDCTMLVARGPITATQANATEKTFGEVLWLLNYAASNPDAEIMYTASNMVLHIHSNGSYLSSSLAICPALPTNNRQPPQHQTAPFICSLESSATSWVQLPKRKLRLPT
jgi:hypothetical protein